MKKFISYFTGKIRAKVFAAVSAVLIVFALAIILTSRPILFRAFTKSTYNNLSSIADTIDGFKADSTEYYFDLYYVSVNNNAGFELIDPEGMLIYTSTGTGSALSSTHFPSAGTVEPEYNSMKESESHKNFSGYDGFEIKRKTSTNVDYFVYRRELKSGNTVCIYSSVADVDNIVGVAEKVYAVFVITLFTLMGIVFYIITSRFVKPVEEMNDVTGDMAALNFDRKCEDYGNDEMGELGRSINALSTTLDSALTDLKEKNKQLESDIELRLDLDNQRKSFISNVSHELKTPIAIISGYAEGLCEGISDDPQTIRDYCGIIKDESEKMNSLVLELLELSKLESKTRPFNPDYFDIGYGISTLISHLSIRIESEGIKIENKVPESLMCYGEGDKIEIVLKNYITNAISHCGGEKLITIGCEEKDDIISIGVFNTGENISEEDMSGIWNSFYRADKSHKRNENRFGLGLSIVKSIMENHGCPYSVQNKENGVEFTFGVAKDKSFYEKKAD